jgi:hypothetical protein
VLRFSHSLSLVFIYYFEFPNRSLHAPFAPAFMTSTQSSQPSQAKPISKVMAAVNGQKQSFWMPDIASYFIAGGAAGAASRTVVSPLERLKIIQ